MLQGSDERQPYVLPGGDDRRRVGAWVAGSLGTDHGVRHRLEPRHLPAFDLGFVRVRARRPEARGQRSPCAALQRGEARGGRDPVQPGAWSCSLRLLLMWQILLPAHVLPPEWRQSGEFPATARLVADPAGFAARMAALLDLDADRLRLWLFARCVQECLDEPELYEVAVRLAP